MKLATESDVTKVNEILNDPSCRPYLAPGDYPLDMTGWTSRMMIFFDNTGVIVGESMGDGEYLGLSAILPEGRGLRGVIAHRHVLDDMFFKYDAFRILATVEPTNIRSLRHLSALGFKTMYPGCGKIHAEIDFIQWALLSDKCLEAGRPLVHILGRPLYEAEMRMLGAFVLTVRRSEGRYTGKAFMFFNRFAKLSRLEFLAPANEEWTEFFYCGKQFKITHTGLMEV